MSNTNASEDNIESPSTYGGQAYEQHRKEEKKKKQHQSEKIAESKLSTD